MMARLKRAQPAWRLWANGLRLGLASLTLTAAGQSWVQTTSLPDGYQEHALVYASGFLYQTGGASATYAELNGTNVFYSQVFSNGAIGVWKKTTPMPEAVLDHTSVAANGFLYVLGGTHYTPAKGDFLTNTVYYAQINSDGSLSSWQVANPLPYSVSYHSTSAWNSRIYVVGGSTDTGLKNNVYSATILSDGSLSTWVAQTSVPVTGGIFAHASVANGFLYILGGAIIGGSQIVNTVYYSKINADGTLAGWSQTTLLPQGVISFATVASSGRIFTMGGWNGTTPVNNFYSAQVAGDGTVVTWSANTPMPQSLAYHAAAVRDSFIFVSGGENPVQSTASVYSMALPAPPVMPTLVARSFTNGNFQLQLASNTNTGFGLLASTNLTAWTNLGWGFTGTNGTLILTDTNAAHFPHRFYRAYWPLP